MDARGLCEPCDAPLVVCCGSDVEAAALVIGTGIDSGEDRRALAAYRPDVRAVYDPGAMDAVLELMVRRGCIDDRPTGYLDPCALEEMVDARRAAAEG